MPFLTQIIDESSITPDVDAAIRRSLCICFPADVGSFAKTRSWHGSGPTFSVLIEHHGQVIAHVGIVDRTVRFGPTPVRAAGVQNVIVLPAYRGKGLSDAVMTTAVAESRRRGFDLGVLFCISPLAKVYARMGWQLIDRDVLRRDDDGIDKPLPGTNLAMIYPLRITQAPAGVIYLEGNDW